MAKQQVWRSQPVVADPKRLRSLTPVMSEGIAVEGFAKILETHHGASYPLHVARLRFFDAAAAEANRQWERTHDSVMHETQHRGARQETRQAQIVAEIVALGKEEVDIRSLMEESRISVARLSGRFGLHLRAYPVIDNVPRLAEARRTRSQIAKGEPTPKTGFSGFAERVGNLLLAFLFAVPLSISIGLNMHLFSVRILENPEDAPFALVLCYAVAFGVEFVLGAFAEQLGKEECGDKPTPTIARCFATFAFYLVVISLAFMEGLALDKISRFNASSAEPSLPLGVFILIGAAVNFTYVGFRIKKGAHKRGLADIENALLGGSDFSQSDCDARALSESTNQLALGERRLQSITARIKVLTKEHEQTLSESISKQSWDVLRQYGVEARSERERTEKELERITNALEKLPSSFLRGYRGTRRDSGGVSPASPHSEDTK